MWDGDRATGLCGGRLGLVGVEVRVGERTPHGSGAPSVTFKGDKSQ